MATHRDFKCSICGDIKAEIPFESFDTHQLYCQSCDDKSRPITNNEFEVATQRHAEFINSLLDKHPPKDVMEVLSHNMASLIGQLDMCCQRGVIEFPDGDKWAVTVSSHEDDIEAIEIGVAVTNAGLSGLAH